MWSFILNRVILLIKQQGCQIGLDPIPRGDESIHTNVILALVPDILYNLDGTFAIDFHCFLSEDIMWLRPNR